MFTLAGESPVAPGDGQWHAASGGTQLVAGSMERGVVGMSLAVEEAMKRVLFGVLWCIVLYFGACMLTGAIAGGMAGGDDPAHAYEAGAQAGAEAVKAWRGYYLVGAVVLAAAGTWTGWLPGTRPKRQPDTAA